jgi:DNA primase
MRYADYLIERARAMFPARSPEAKVKALNMLLPHIRRVPNAISRSEFAENAAQKLGIESSLMRQELKQAAAQRLESVKAAQPRAVTEVERILLSALVLPDADGARQIAAERLGAHPEWFAELPCGGLIEVLVSAPAPENPFEAAPDEASRALLALALQGSEGEILAAKVKDALDSLHEKYLERRLREIRLQIAEAQRRGDDEMLMKLAQEKVRLDRELKS